MRARGVSDGGIDHNLDGLAGLLKFIGNGVVEQARVRFKQHFPHSQQHRLDPIGDEDRRAIIKAANMVPSEKWRRMEAYGMAVLTVCSGLRPKEFKVSTIVDLNLYRGMMHVEEVKGNGRYGEPRDVNVHPDGRPFLRRYLEARAAVLEKNNLVSNLLFPVIPNLKRGKDCAFSTSGTTDLRAIVKKETGVDFDYRACRRTYGQVWIDQGVSLNAVSRMMGHATTKTTEIYYARIKNDAAIMEAEMAYHRHVQECNSGTTVKVGYLDQGGGRTG